MSRYCTNIAHGNRVSTTAPREKTGPMNGRKSWMTLISVVHEPARAESRPGLEPPRDSSEVEPGRVVLVTSPVHTWTRAESSGLES